MGSLVKVPRLPKCDFCMMEQKSTEARYDAKTKGGPWANMCEPHYLQWRAFPDLGTGKGQELVLAPSTSGWQG